MSVSYSGIHSITFFKNDDSSFKNTWGDFHMVPTSRPYITPPPAQIKMVSLPRSNKILDLTNSLTRNVTYEAREGDWEFYIDHDKWEDWTQAFDDISDYLDGSVFHVIMADEPLYSYNGRVYVSDYSPESNYSKFRVHYTLDAICEVYEYVEKATYPNYIFDSSSSQIIDGVEWHSGPVFQMDSTGYLGGIVIKLNGASYSTKYYVNIEDSNYNQIARAEMRNALGYKDFSTRYLDGEYGGSNYTCFIPVESTLCLVSPIYVSLYVKKNEYDGRGIHGISAGICNKIDEIVI